ncbi:MBL fold metallo-hydrolase [Candidatus Thorarchaeota archaeon]|nr:MAG: MBL fold metallo-hydrolase [Candidatus Thorarchaeota archaeon]
MASREIVPGIVSIQGEYEPGFGYLTSQLILGDEELVIVDPGTAGSPGREVIETIEELGFNSKSDVAAILCTHGHPDHIGGCSRIQKHTKAPVMIHNSDAILIENPSSFIQDRLRLDFAGKLAMKLERGPLKVNYKSISVDKKLQGNESLSFGDIEVEVIHTGGHSQGHCVFYVRDTKTLFSGDELNNYPNNPRKFYVDLSGSLTAKADAARKLQELEINTLIPSHDEVHLDADVPLQFREVRSGIIDFQDAILNHVSARGDVDIEQLVYDIKQSRSVPIPEGLDSLLPTTIVVCLHDLEKAGLVRQDLDDIWHKV